jgi:hypothetical protein
LLSTLTDLSLLIAVFALVYAFSYGVIEVLGLSAPRLSSGWQVPLSWVKGRSTQIQTIIWGSVLGPGLLTINPYASMWLLPCMIVLASVTHHLFVAVSFGILIGVAHGGGRALGMLNNEREKTQSGSSLLPFAIMVRQPKWRHADGYVLLAATGPLLTYVLYLLDVFK